MRQTLSMISGPAPQNILQSPRGILFMLAKNYLPVHESTNNEGRGSNAIEILGTQLEVG